VARSYELSYRVHNDVRTEVYASASAVRVGLKRACAIPRSFASMRVDVVDGGSVERRRYLCTGEGSNRRPVAATDRDSALRRQNPRRR
jgi:hypothetical protein